MSKPAPLLKGSVKDGQPVFDRPMMWKMALGALEGKRFECSLRRESKRKSVEQRGYYRAVIVKMIAEATEDFGRDGEERVHKGLAYMFLTKTDLKTGLKYVQSTEDLDTVQTEEYYEKCRVWANMELSLWIPLPNESEIYE